MGKSLAQIVAELPEDEREDVLAGLDQDNLLYDFSFWGRPEQIPPLDNSWDIGLFLAGRGAGKTRSSCEWLQSKARKPGTRMIIAARTVGDLRDTLVNGDSGMLNVGHPDDRPMYYSSRRSLEWANGSRAILASADVSDSFRGIQAEYAIADEIAAWKRVPAGELSAWDNLRIATRLGPHPQILAATTPKRTPVIYDLMTEAEKTGRIWVSRGSTADNSGNLSESYLSGIYGLYENTTLGRQELYGELLSKLEGALFTEEMFEDNRVYTYPMEAPLRVIGVDPTVSATPGDECGIIAVASTSEHDLYKRHAWVIEDATLKGSPDVWAQEVVRMARKYRCPVVAETNQGGALVQQAINTIDGSIKVYTVHSKVGKALRAEPVVAAYEQGRVSHVNYLPDLETQMLNWVPEFGHSPDRLDAAVHGLTSLLIDPPKGFLGGSLVASSPSAHRLPSIRTMTPNPTRDARARAGLRLRRY